MIADTTDMNLTRRIPTRQCCLWLASRWDLRIQTCYATGRIEKVQADITRMQSLLPWRERATQVASKSTELSCHFQKPLRKLHFGYLGINIETC